MCINQIGNIYCGNFTSDIAMNGWVVSYLGYQNTIEVGWYFNNLREGNWMAVDAQDMSIR